MTQSRFEQRRAEFMERLGDTIAIVPAGGGQVRNDDVDHPFRQDSNFFFLTGFDEPESIAVFDPAHGTEPYTLFVRERDPDAEAWNGRRAGVEGAIGIYGADAALTLEAFDSWLRTRLRGRSSAAYSIGGARDDQVLAALTAARKISDRLGTAAPDRLIDPGVILDEMRLIKSPDEVDALRQACHISAVAHTEAMRFVAPGRTERQVQAAIEYVFGSMDAERVGYGSIVAGGNNAVILHYIENNQTLSDGDLLLVDAGAEYRHLTADITRTFPVNGRFTAPQRALYDVILDAEEQVIQLCSPGLPYTEMHAKAVEVLTVGIVDLGLLPGTAEEAVDKGWYREFFFHGTGHWLGIDVHDAGADRVSDSGRLLEPGMALTVEPGIYVAPHKTAIELSHASFDPEDAIRLNYELGPAAAKKELTLRRNEADSITFSVPTEFLGMGIRIEDDILITASGHDNLSAEAPVKPDEIEALCAESSDFPLFP